MASYSAPPPTRSFDSRHTADQCAVCSAFCAGATAMVVAARSCDGLRERVLVERCDATLGIFSRHMGDMQRCIVTTYAHMATTIYDHVAVALVSGDVWSTSVRDGIVAAVQAIDRVEGGTYFFFVAADQSRDPVMWLERSAAQEDLVHLIGAGPAPGAFDLLQAEMFCGAWRNAMRRRALTGGGFADADDLAAHVAALMRVFGA